ncbi:prepilin-type N-terminal cleavage/methylation domain-containing protein [bacterium]|nr:prepilin-type N-terminal cleavage/methylation domain-containing protein [bacterium]
MKLQATGYRPQASGFKKACGLRLAACSWQHGFTLIEILIAVAIVSLILTIIYGSYASSIDTMNYTREKMDAFSMIRLTLNRMNDELTSSFISSDGHLKFVGEEGKVDFISSSHERIFKNSKEYDLVEVSYFTGAAEEEESLFLWRREDRTPDDDVLEGGEREKLMEGLEGIEFKYYDGEEWRLEWDSKEEKELPQAVKVILKFPKKELSTTAFVPLGKSKESEQVRK